MKAFVAFLKHDDANRVTSTDVVAFKDHRLATINPRTDKPISPKTVKDSDLAGLKAVFDWAVINRRMASNPAAGVTLRLGKPAKLRSKGFTDEEASAILKATLQVGGEREFPETRAAKRWVPWICAYSGARVGEIAQLRKCDVRKDGEHWIITITPEAGTVKTNEARSFPVHAHLVEQGFLEFVAEAPDGHLFLRPGDDGDVLGPLQGVKNRLGEFARKAIPEAQVAPTHGWRHRFKTIGLEAGIDHRVLDAIQGHSARTQGESYGDVTMSTMAAAMAKVTKHETG
jgi:integrase